MIQKKYNKKTIQPLIKTLFKSKTFYGKSISLYPFNKNILPFIYGIRDKHLIINLKFTSIMLKRIFKLIKNFIKNKKKILIIGNSNEIDFLINKNLIKKNKILYLNYEWINGLITNKKIKILINKNQIDLILIIKSSVPQNFLNKELSIFKKPIISFINTDQQLTYIDYPILTNSENIKSLYNLMYLIRKLF